jgi:5-methylcytosine-specific restriction endonuclease McrA
MPRARYVPKWRKGHKQACRLGHALTPENIVGNRQCRICARGNSQRYKAKVRQAKNPNLRVGALRKLKLFCSNGHPRSMRRPGRHDCAQCRRTTNPPRPRRTPEELRTQRQKWEATRRAKKSGRFVEVVNRQVVFDRDKGVCGICHTPVDPTRYEVDHVVPLAAGGEHSYANAQLAHPTCNRRKWAKVAA